MRRDTLRYTASNRQNRSDPLVGQRRNIKEEIQMRTAGHRVTTSARSLPQHDSNAILRQKEGSVSNKKFFATSGNECYSASNSTSSNPKQIRLIVRRNIHRLDILVIRRDTGRGRRLRSRTGVHEFLHAQWPCWWALEDWRWYSTVFPHLGPPTARPQSPEQFGGAGGHCRKSNRKYHPSTTKQGTEGEENEH